MSWDPREDGALCDYCPLGPNGPLRDPSFPWSPVKTELHGHNDQAIAILENPAETEVREGRPAAGDTGTQCWNPALVAIGMKRSDVAIGNVLCCFPGNPARGAYGRMEARLRALNEQLRAQGLPEWMHPKEACRPRLWHDISRFHNLIALGGTALEALSGSKRSILEATGDMIEVPTSDPSVKRKLLPLPHPAFINQAPHYREMFERNLAKAFRWFRGEKNWTEPVYEWRPTPARLRAWLREPARFTVHDYETTLHGALRSQVYCIGFARLIEPPEWRTCEKCNGSGLRYLQFDREQGWITAPLEVQHLPCECCEGRRIRLVEIHSVLVPILSCEDGETRFYTAGEEEQVKDAIREHFQDPTAWKVGHNCLYSGTPVILGNGDSEPIDKLVRSKYSGTVKAMDESGLIVEAQVLGWFREVVPNQEWIVIRREGEKAGSRGLTLTPDHEVFTQRGRVRADSVSVGDFLLTEEPELYPWQRAAVLGTLLGDSVAVSSTTKDGKKVRRPIADSTTACLVGNHTSKQLVEEKMRWLSGFLSVREGVATTGYKPGIATYAYSTLALRQIADLAKMVYNPINNKRRITAENLNALGPIGLAWLYADDGFKHVRRDHKREAMLIATCGFTSEEIEEARVWFCDKYGPTTVTKTGSVRLGSDAAEKFATEIAPWLLPAARYKLPAGTWPEFVGFPIRVDYTPHKVRVESVSVYTPPRKTRIQKQNADTRWCIKTTTGNFMTAFGLVKNCWGFDNVVSEQWLGVTPYPSMDTLPLARARNPAAKKGLKIVGGMLCDIHAWGASVEGTRIAEAPRNDRQLHTYCAAGDASVNAKIFDQLVSDATEKGYFQPIREDLRPPAWPSHVPWTLQGVDDWRQGLCRHMMRAGMYVDQRKREAHKVALQKESREHAAAARAQAHAMGFRGPAKTKKGGSEPFNPWSDRQVGHILYSVWGFVPHHFSEETGQPSTDDESLREVLTSPEATDEQRAFVNAIRRCRRARKAESNFIDRMAREDLWVPQYTKKGKLIGRPPVCWPDGRVHPSWTELMTEPARTCSRDPNVNVIPVRFRDIFAAQPIYPEGDPRYPGRVYFGGDVDQFHLRLIANRWGISRLLQAFLEGLDPHSMLAHDFFGSKFVHADGWPNGFSLKIKDKPIKGSAADWMRHVAKVIRYRGAYKDDEAGILQSVREVENPDTGELPFARTTLREVRKHYRAWMRAEPEWERAWTWVQDTYRQNGNCLYSGMFGRRSGDCEGGKAQKVINTDVLPLETDCFTLIEHGVRQVFPDNCDGPGTGIVHSGYDALEVEAEGFAWIEVRNGKKVVVCDPRTEQRRRDMEDAMNLDLSRQLGWQVKITAEVKVAPVRDEHGRPCLSNWKAA